MNRATDRVALLEAMMSDTARAPADYSIDGPTAAFLDQFYGDIKSKGLREMALEGSRLLNTIGACNYSPLQQMNYNLGQRLAAGEIDAEEHRVLSEASRIIFEKGRVGLLPYELSLDDLNRAAYRACDLYAASVGARPPSELNFSDALYPEYMFEIDGRQYSYLGLYYYCRYVFTAQHVDLDGLDHVVEIGSGSGRAVEVFKKLHPQLTYHLLDLGPQLYVSQRFLEAVFGEGALVPYGSAQVRPGAMHFYPHYRIADLQLDGRVLAWSTMVYCIMSPDRARRYFDQMRRVAEFVYIAEPTTEAGGAQYGLPEPTTFSHYLSFMEGYHLLGRQPVFRPLARIKAWGGVDEAVWAR